MFSCVVKAKELAGITRSTSLWNFKHVAVLNNIYKWCTVIVVSDSRNMILKRRIGHVQTVIDAVGSV